MVFIPPLFLDHPRAATGWKCAAAALCRDPAPAEQIAKSDVVNFLKAEVAFQEAIEIGIQQVLDLISAKVTGEGGLTLQCPFKAQNQFTEASTGKLSCRE